MGFENEAHLATAAIVNGVARYVLTQPLSCTFAGSFVLVVPAGFETDFASVPRLLWPIFPPAGQYTRAAIVHDWLYQHFGVSRMLADAIFRDLMRELGVPGWKRWLMWAAVRLWGWRYYRGDIDDSLKEAERSAESL